MERKRCRIKGCREKHSARGFCKHHYMTVWFYQDPHRAECSIEGCEQKIHAQEYCNMHYHQWLRGELGKTKPRRETCLVPDCGRKHVAGGYCNLHYLRVKLTGTTEKRPLQKEKPCRMPGCPNLAFAKGFCEPDYDRWRKRLKRFKEKLKKQREKRKRESYVQPVKYLRLLRQIAAQIDKNEKR